MQFTFALKTNFLLKPLKKDAIKSLFLLRKAKEPMLRDHWPPKPVIRAESAELSFQRNLRTIQC